MKYLALVYYQQSEMDRLSQQQWDELNHQCMACVENLQASGHYVGGHPLEPVQTATTLRVRDQKTLITDGPFAETKEQLAGFYILQARDLNEAIQLAEKIPPARYGSIEIRPVRELKEHNNSGVSRTP